MFGSFTWQCAWCACWNRQDESLCRQCKAIRGTHPLGRSLMEFNPMPPAQTFDDLPKIVAGRWW